MSAFVDSPFMYLTLCSARNRMRVRLRRLREPRYLAGLIVGFLLLAAVGVGVTKGLGALYNAAFPGILGFLWIAAIIGCAAIAFVFAIGWLWIVAAVVALMLGWGYAAKDND